MGTRVTSALCLCARPRRSRGTLTVRDIIVNAEQGQHVMIDVSASIFQLSGRGQSSVLQAIMNGSWQEWIRDTASHSDNSSCAKLKLYSDMDLQSFSSGQLSLSTGMKPWCESNVCISSGGELSVQCNLTNLVMQLPLERRRLQETPKMVFSFDTVGTGKNNLNFGDLSMTSKVVSGKNVDFTETNTPGTGTETPSTPCHFIRIPASKYHELLQKNIHLRLNDGTCEHRETEV